MTANAGEIVLPGLHKFWVAPVGTAAPATHADALNAAFKDVGYRTDDGVTFSDIPTTEPVMALESFYKVRNQTTQRTATFGMTLQQWDKETLKLYYGGGTFTMPSAGVFKYEPPVTGDAPYERAGLLEFRDGASRIYRIVVPRFELQSAEAFTLGKGTPAVLAMTFDALGSDSARPWYQLSNDVAMDPAA